MKYLRYFMIVLFGMTGAGAASDWQVLSLSAKSEHGGIAVWSGKFTAMNGRNYDASAFYTPTNQPFSVKSILAKSHTKNITWLMPLTLDAGFDARLYQAEPLLGLGTGAAIGLSDASMLSIRFDNLLRLGGGVSEQPCYDGFRRQFHCGTGMAWTDYQSSEASRRTFGEAAIKIRFVQKFSF